MHDVAIIGAGPVGSFVAERLARQGYEVLVFEEHEEVGYPAHCTGLIGEEGFAKFDLPAETTQHLVSAIKVIGPLGAEFSFTTRKPLARVIDRPRFDAVMARRAELAGARFLLGTRVTNATVDESGVTVHVQKEQKTYRARSLVLATGGRSQLPARLGLGRLPRYIYGVQLETEMEDVQQVEVYIGRRLAPGSFCWVVPTTAGKAKVGLLAYDCPTERLQALLEHPRVKPRLQSPLGKPMVAPIPLGTLPATVTDRVLAVGEAAGQVKTTTGGGVYYGLLCAEIASEVLGEALAQDNLTRDKLAAYERRWRQLIHREIETGLMLRNLALSVSDLSAASLLNLASRNGIGRTIKRLARFDWHATLITSVLDRLVSQ